MLNKYGTILLSILNACFFCFGFHQWKKSKADNATTSITIHALERKNDSLKIAASLWQERCVSFQNRAKALESSLPKIKGSIKKINTHRHEKQHILDSCSVTELVRFFSNIKTNPSLAEQ